MTTKFPPQEFTCHFERGTRYKFSRLAIYLQSLEKGRSRDNAFSSAIALSTARCVRAIFDELYPLHIFARHRELGDAAEFEWQAGGRDETGVDFVVFRGPDELHLQVTVTGPIWKDAAPPFNNLAFSIGY